MNLMEMLQIPGIDNRERALEEIRKAQEVRQKHLTQMREQAALISSTQLDIPQSNRTC